MDTPTERICTKCRIVKPFDEFSVAPRGKYGLKASCKACDHARYRAKNPPKERVRKPYFPPKQGTDAKTCKRCGLAKTIDEFSLARRATETRNAVYKSDCKQCSSERAMQWFRDNPGRTTATKRKFNLAKLYGLTAQEYDRMLRAQGGVCAICCKDEPSAHGRTGRKFRLSVDHCHDTGAVRGLLCQRCNRAIGLLGDDPILMRRAITYLLRRRVEAAQ